MDAKAKYQYDKEYAKEKIKQIGLGLNVATDKDILDWLALQSNKQGYIKELIRSDMKSKLSKDLI